MTARRDRYNCRMSEPDAERTRAGLRPGGAVTGDVTVPTSKSIAQRACVAAALASGATRISALPRGEDVTAALALVAAAGADVRRLAPAAVSITGRPPGPHRGWRAEAPLDAGESGTLARLATAAASFAGLAGRPLEIVVRGTLARRRSRALFEALRSSGVRIEARDDDAWPARIVPIGPPSTVRIVRPASSQEVSALLLALSAYPDDVQLQVKGRVPSRPYLEMTIGTLGDFGARVLEETPAHDGDGEPCRVFHVRGPLRAPADPIVVEPDASSAAVALAAACLSGGHVRVAGIARTTRQGDARIVEHLRVFGCDASHGDDGLSARGAPVRGAHLDLAGEPDLAPVLAIVAACAAASHGARSRLDGLGTLPGKESSRIDVLAHGLSAAGFAVVATDASLEVGPGVGSTGSTGVARVPEIVLDAHGDHRMAFAFALLGLVRERVWVDGADCVRKSWPGFFDAMERAGARVHAERP